MSTRRRQTRAAGQGWGFVSERCCVHTAAPTRSLKPWRKRRRKEERPDSAAALAEWRKRRLGTLRQHSARLAAWAGCDVAYFVRAAGAPRGELRACAAGGGADDNAPTQQKLAPVRAAMEACAAAARARVAVQQQQQQQQLAGAGGA